MSGVIVGRRRGRYLVSHGQQFILLAAPTGSGKGVACVIPNLLHYADSVVVFDLKLENFRITSGFRERNGQRVFLFAPFAEDGRTHRWNMLDAVSRSPGQRVGDILAIGQVFYPGDCDPREKFWNDNARNLFLAFVLYLLETPELPCTMGEVFRQSSGKGKHLKDHVQSLIAKRRAGGTSLSDDCVDAFARFLSSPENTLGNIVTSFNAPLLVFANPRVDAATTSSDFDVRELRRQRCTIYIGVQPVHLGDAALIVNMLFSQIVNQNTRVLPENDPSLRYECLLMLDEFPALGRLGVIAKASAYIRGYKLRLLTIIQSVSQLEAVYGAAETRTMVTNHGLQIIFPPHEQRDAREYSEMLGYTTVKSRSKGSSRPRAFGQSGSSSENVTDQKRALMLPQELKEMPPGQQIVTLENTRAILCEKAKYFEDWRFVGPLVASSPYLTGLDEEFKHAGWRSRVRRLFPSQRLPAESELKHAAFVLHELSAKNVPSLSPLMAEPADDTCEDSTDDELDYEVLILDADAIPPLPGENPSREAAGAAVSAMFTSMQRLRQSTDKSREAPDHMDGDTRFYGDGQNVIECVDDPGTTDSTDAVDGTQSLVLP